MINVVNVGCGNFSSVKNWVNQYTSKVQIISNPNQFVDGPIILPGVSSATQLMINLRSSGFESFLKELNYEGKKIIGICAGFQVLGTSTTEGTGASCLDLLPVEISRMKDSNDKDISCTGWKNVEILIKENSKLKNNFPRRKILRGEAYFNHEYGAEANEKITKHDYIFGISQGYYTHIIKNNIYGFQFHPEKSSIFGRELLGILR